MTLAAAILAAAVCLVIGFAVGQANRPDWLRLHAEMDEHHYTLDHCRVALQEVSDD